MNVYSRWIKRFAITAIVIIFPLVLFNFVVDPNGVFDIVSIKGFNQYKTSSISDRITKFYYARRFKPDSLIIGTSRAAFISPFDMGKYTKDKVYNFATYGSNPYEHYLYLRYMTEFCTIKHMILGLDFTSFISEVRAETYFEEKRFERTIYLKDYFDSLFTNAAIKSSYDTVKDNIVKKDIIQNDENGFKFWKKTEGAKDKAKFAKRSKRVIKHFGKNLYPSANERRETIQKNLHYLGLIIALARGKNIEYKLFVSPIYGELFDLIYAVHIGDLYEDWKRRLAELSNFYDFTGHNEITDSNMWWGDPSHIVTDGGKLIVARIYHDTDVPIPDGFGVLVTKQNVENHIKSLRHSVKAIDLRVILR
jgi:hypothetical protein